MKEVGAVGTDSQNKQLQSQQIISTSGLIKVRMKLITNSSCSIVGGP